MWLYLSLFKLLNSSYCSTPSCILAKARVRSFKASWITPSSSILLLSADEMAGDGGFRAWGFANRFHDDAGIPKKLRRH